MIQRKRSIIVIGGGLTGLTCAFHLQRYGYDVEVLEKTNRIGGLMQTCHAEGFVMEEGPSTGTIKYPEVAELFDYLGDRCVLERADAGSKVRLIWKGTRFHALPSGIVSGLRTPLFTLKDKFGLLLEPFRKKGNNPNETVGELAERRLGKSLVDYAVDPFLSGVYASDPYTLPTRWALPRLYRLEQRYGSFIRGAIAMAKQPKTVRERRATKEVFSVKGGFGKLTEALADSIGRERISLSCDGLHITPLKEGWKATWDGGEVIADEVVTACPSYELPALLSFLRQSQRKALDNLYYAPVIEIGVGMQETGTVEWRAFGGLVPSKEGKEVLGVLMPSACFAERAPKGGANYAYFLGGMRHTDYLEKSDEELKTIVMQSLHTMLKYPQGTTPDVVRIFRHERAIPQYLANTEERLNAITEVEQAYPTLHIAGNLRDGIGMGDRIKQAADVAQQIRNRRLTVLVTAPENYAQRFSEALKAVSLKNGQRFEPIVLPLIETELKTDDGLLDDFLKNIATFDYVLFASRRAIDAVAEGLKRNSVKLPSQLGYIAIGKDGEYLEHVLGVKSCFVDGESSLMGVVRSLASDAKIAEKRIAVLTPKTEGMTEPSTVPDFLSALKQTNMEVVCVPVYLTRRAREAVLERVATLLSVGLDLVALTSGAEAQVYQGVLKGKLFKNQAIKRPEVACFGPYTAKCAKESGLSVDFVSKEFHSFAAFSENLQRWKDEME